MPKKKVTSERKGYLTYMDYFATGEGRTVELNFCYADTSDEAKKLHLDKFVGERKEARDYFGVGIDVMPIKSKKSKDLLGEIFKFGEGLHKNLVEAGIEFHLKVYFNYN